MATIIITLCGCCPVAATCRSAIVRLQALSSQPRCEFSRRPQLFHHLSEFRCRQSTLLPSSYETPRGIPGGRLRQDERERTGRGLARGVTSGLRRVFVIQCFQPGNPASSPIQFMASSLSTSWAALTFWLVHLPGKRLLLSKDASLNTMQAAAADLKRPR